MEDSVLFGKAFEHFILLEVRAFLPYFPWKIFLRKLWNGDII
jgi:hypothetical protein